MKEFYASAKWRMKLPKGLSGVAGAVIFPSGVPYHTLTRRDLSKSYPHMQRRLVDPQIYLLGLNPATCRSACTNLLSYGWFPSNKQPVYDSGQLKQADWKKMAQSQVVSDWIRDFQNPAAIDAAIRRCIESQVELGVEALILPGPLTTDINSDFSVELDWLERSVNLASQIAPTLGRYASVAFSDTALRTLDPWSNTLLDLVLDQVTAREISGVYLVIEQANEEGYYCTHPNTVGAILRLCNGFKQGGVDRVFVCYAGTAGLLACAAGADAWCTGWYRSERRLKLSDLEFQEGRSSPAYYSHPFAGEFHLESDLDRVVKRGFLPRIADKTPISEGLLKALAAGKTSNSVPEWEHKVQNISASIDHFLTVAARETSELSALSAQEAEAYASRWLEGADRLASDLYTVGGFHLRTSVTHQHGWRQAFESYVSNKV